MKLFSQRSRVCALIIVLGLTIASCVMRGGNPKLGFPDSRSLTATEADATTKAAVQTAYGKLPLSFEANHGQSDGQVKFLSRGSGYNLFLTPTEAVIALQPPSEKRDSKEKRIIEKEKEEGGNPQSAIHNLQSTVLRLQLVGANPHATVSGVDELPGRVNYIAGQDSTKWHTNILTFAKVKYKGVYPGVDLIYYGNDQRQLEYDFQVAPGIDPTIIKLKFEGVDTLDLDSEGDLVLHATGGKIRQQRPHIYQEIAGVRQTVSGGYVITGKREVAFHVGHYDASLLLVIDPVIAYSTYLGGSGYEFSGDKDAGNDIAVDTAGNIYVVGATNSLGHGDSDVFVRKFNPSGSTLLYETYLDSNRTDDTGYGITVDAAGNAYVTGKFGDWLLGHGRGVLVAKLNPAGVPLYQVAFGADSASGYSGDIGRGIAVDAAGNAYVVGTTSWVLQQPFPTTTGAFQRTFGGGDADAFVVKLNPFGGFVYSTLLGGAGDDTGFSIALDTLGNAYVTGATDSGTDFPITAGAFQRTFGGESDVFVTKLNPTGSAPVYSTFLGGNGADTGRGIALDAACNVLLTGMTEEVAMTVNNFPVVNAFQPTYGGTGANSAWANAFVTKLNSAGSALVYSSYMGGAGDILRDEGHDIAADEAGNAYLTGYTKTYSDIFTGIGFPIVNAFQPTHGGGVSDAFITKLTPQGALVYSSYLGGNGAESGSGIALGAAGSVYVTGTTSSQDFPIMNAFQPNPGGGSNCDTSFGECYDAFVVKISDKLTLTVTKAGTGSGTVMSSPAGINCGTDCTENYNSETAVTLTATSAAGSTFAGWSGDVDCVDGTVAMTANKTCTARFNPATASADLLVSALSGPSVSAAGAIITVTETTKNQGSSAAGASTTKFYLSTNTTFETGDVLLGSRALPALAAGISNTASIAVSIPATTAVGSYYLLARADANVVVPETNETNNMKTKALSLGPDLVVSALSAPASGGVGTTITATNTVKNQGGSGAGTSTTKFYLSTNTTFGTGDVLLGSRSVPALAVGMSQSAWTSLAIPAGMERGNYFILAVSDANQVVKEAKEGNNVKSTTFTIP